MSVFERFVDPVLRGLVLGGVAAQVVLGVYAAAAPVGLPGWVIAAMLGAATIALSSGMVLGLVWSLVAWQVLRTPRERSVCGPHTGTS